MNTKTPREVFFLLLSNLRNNTEIASNIYQEISKVAEEPEVKEALVARAFASPTDPGQDRRVFPSDRREAREDFHASP